MAHVYPPAAPANAAVATHAPHFIMPWVRDRQERGGVGARRRLIQARGEALAEGFVWPLGVVALPEPVKAALLGGQRAPRWPCGLRLERFVHPLVAAVLLGVRRLDELGANP